VREPAVTFEAEPAEVVSEAPKSVWETTRAEAMKQTDETVKQLSRLRKELGRSSKDSSSAPLLRQREVELTRQQGELSRLTEAVGTLRTIEQTSAVPLPEAAFGRLNEIRALGIPALTAAEQKNLLATTLKRDQVLKQIDGVLTSLNKRSYGTNPPQLVGETIRRLKEQRAARVQALTGQINGE
jgi:valyl-tRNA synthetase